MRSVECKKSWLVGLSVNAAVDEFDDAFITEVLKLLADFCFYVVVLRVLCFQQAYERVHLLQGEGGAEFFGALEYIEQPSAAFDAFCL